MARYSGKIGYGHAETDEFGDSELVITERSVRGDVLDVSLKNDDSTQVIPNLRPMHSISVVADSYALTNIPAIRYATWLGGRWTITDVKVQHPRLVLRLGEVYHGPTPEETPPDSGGDSG